MRGPCLLLLALLLAGCTSAGQTTTARSATEELLLSTAADRAAEQLKLQLAAGTKAFLDSSDFDATDGKYAIGAIKDSLLRQGIDLVDDKSKADTIIEIRSGALAIVEDTTLVGAPSMTVPVPTATAGGNLSTPEIALYKDWDQLGLAKFAATAYSAKSGELEGSTGAKYGYSHNHETIVLLYLSWVDDDLIPDPQRDPKGTEIMPLQGE